MGKGKKHRIEHCYGCRTKNDVTEAIEIGDYDEVEYRKGYIYIYCQECGKQLEIKIV